MLFIADQDEHAIQGLTVLFIATSLAVEHQIKVMEPQIKAD
ncbi:hypothetical protein [Nostoc sp.]